MEVVPGMSLGSLKPRGRSGSFHLEAGGNQNLRRGRWVKEWGIKSHQVFPGWLLVGVGIPSREERMGT